MEYTALCRAQQRSTCLRAAISGPFPNWVERRRDFFLPFFLLGLLETSVVALVRLVTRRRRRIIISSSLSPQLRGEKGKTVRKASLNLFIPPPSPARNSIRDVALAGRGRQKSACLPPFSFLRRPGLVKKGEAGHFTYPAGQFAHSCMSVAAELEEEEEGECEGPQKASSGRTT